MKKEEKSKKRKFTTWAIIILAIIAMFFAVNYIPWFKHLLGE